MKASSNIHATRESWLAAATGELRAYFEKLNYKLPEKIRAAIAFTSMGKRARIPLECWHCSYSADEHYEIIIRCDAAEPVEVLGRLVPALIHTLLPPDAGCGKDYKEIALRIGLDGPMRHATPTPLLTERLQAIAASLGPLPHGKLDYATRLDKQKKPGVRMLKAECGQDGCGYNVRLLPKWARAGLPVCPLNTKHGRLRCDLPEKNTGDKPDAQ